MYVREHLNCILMGLHIDEFLGQQKRNLVESFCDMNWLSVSEREGERSST